MVTARRGGFNRLEMSSENEQTAPASGGNPPITDPEQVREHRGGFPDFSDSGMVEKIRDDGTRFSERVNFVRASPVEPRACVAIPWERDKGQKTLENLRRFLDLCEVTSENIGNIRRNLLDESETAWNAWVRDETAKREKPAVPAEKWETGICKLCLRPIERKPGGSQWYHANDVRMGPPHDAEPKEIESGYLGLAPVGLKCGICGGDIRPCGNGWLHLAMRAGQLWNHCAAPAAALPLAKTAVDEKVMPPPCANCGKGYDAHKAHKSEDGQEEACPLDGRAGWAETRYEPAPPSCSTCGRPVNGGLYGQCRSCAIAGLKRPEAVNRSARCPHCQHVGPVDHECSHETCQNCGLPIDEPPAVLGFGNCSGCGVAFTEAGGLPGNLCTTCRAKKVNKAFPEEVPLPPKDLGDLVREYQAAKPELPCECHKMAGFRNCPRHKYLCNVGEAPGTDMRELGYGEIMQASDRLSDGEAIPAEWVGTGVQVRGVVFRGVPLGEPPGPEGPAGERKLGPEEVIQAGDLGAFSGGQSEVSASMVGDQVKFYDPIEFFRVDSVLAPGELTGALDGIGECAECKAAGRPTCVCGQEFENAEPGASGQKCAICGLAVELAPAGFVRGTPLGVTPALWQCPEHATAPGTRRLDAMEIMASGDLTANMSGMLDDVPSPWVGCPVGTSEVYRPENAVPVWFATAAEAANAVDRGAVAPTPLTLWQRFKARLFPPVELETPKAPADWKDVIHLNAVTSFSLLDRVRILVSGRVHTQAIIVCQNEVGETKVVSGSRPLSGGVR